MPVLTISMFGHSIERFVRQFGIFLTRWSLVQADHHQGFRNLWLQALDRLEIGFDS